HTSTNSERLNSTGYLREVHLKLKHRLSTVVFPSIALRRGVVGVQARSARMHVPLAYVLRIASIICFYINIRMVKLIQPLETTEEERVVKDTWSEREAIRLLISDCVFA
ncbi:hypothetical protein Dimus_009974, partial [Dionaea muscipula]